MNTEQSYSILKRAISEPAYLQQLLAAPDQILKGAGISDPSAVGEIKELARILGMPSRPQTSPEMPAEWKSYYADQLQSAGALFNAFRDALKKTINQIESGFSLTSLMYTISFSLGALLIVFALLFAASKSESIVSIAFGGLGMADLIAFFITRPPQQLQSSRADLAQLQLAFYNWYQDNADWSWYGDELWNWGNADFVGQRMKEVSEIMMANTAKTMELIEKYCEFDKKETAATTGATQPATAATAGAQLAAGDRTSSGVGLRIPRGTALQGPEPRPSRGGGNGRHRR